MAQIRHQGYALIAALILLVVASLGVAVAVQSAQLDSQREREDELLFVGDQFRQAIHAYASAAGVPAQYPQKLEDLLGDRRSPVPHRYLRRIYIDPMTGKADWELDLLQGRIVGMHSHSGAVPLRHANFSPADAGFENARTYAEWTFNGAGAAAGSAQVATVGAGAGTNSASSDSIGLTAQPPPATDPTSTAPAIATNCNSDYSFALQHCESRLAPNDRRPCQVQASAQFQECLAAAAGH